MSWVSGNPPDSARAYSLLTDRTWRLRHSAWMLWAILSCGFLSFIGLGYVASKTKQRRWWIYTALWAVVAGAFFAYSSLTADVRKANAEGSLSSGVGSVLVMLSLASIVHVAFLNRPWLRWLAEDQARRETAVNALVHGFQQSAPPLATEASLPPVLKDLGISSGEFYGAGPAAQAQPLASRPAPGPGTDSPERGPVRATNSPEPLPGTQQRLGVNTASAEEFQAALGIGPDRSALIVRERSTRGPYRTLEDFGLRAGLTPVELNRARDRVSVEPIPSQAPSTGRVLDL